MMKKGQGGAQVVGEAAGCVGVGGCGAEPCRDTCKHHQHPRGLVGAESFGPGGPGRIAGQQPRHCLADQGLGLGDVLHGSLVQIRIPRREFAQPRRIPDRCSGHRHEQPGHLPQKIVVSGQTGRQVRIKVGLSKTKDCVFLGAEVVEERPWRNPGAVRDRLNSCLSGVPLERQGRSCDSDARMWKRRRPVARIEAMGFRCAQQGSRIATISGVVLAGENAILFSRTGRPAPCCRSKHCCSLLGRWAEPAVGEVGKEDPARGGAGQGERNDVGAERAQGQLRGQGYTDAGGDHALRLLIVVGSEGDARLKAGGAADAAKDIGHGVFVAHDPFLVPQSFDPYGFLLRKGVIALHEQHSRVVHQPDQGQILILDLLPGVVPQQRQFDVAPVQPLQQAVPSGTDDRDCDLRMAGSECENDIWHEGSTDCGKGSHPQLAPAQPGKLCHFGAGGFDCPVDVVGVPEEGLPGLGENHAPRMPIHQRNAHLMFELRYLLRDG